ncbi:glycoside hydrolase, family 18 [Clostridium aceticum]|uniref:Glycoside hydrolase, family 18 n=1 Tax=Clostridium aceticum TaxID=84022 RepID=A0A0G3W854_9CLOT|nr:glycosyl hydrolase family 18 protein [Clostridium aceticum]AKL94020.1 glycoside hydrolase, family 18 [Clostridium aceticum]
MRAAVRKQKKKKMHVVSLLLCLVVAFSAVFYLYNPSILQRINDFTNSIGFSFADNSRQQYVSNIMITDKTFEGNTFIDKGTVYLDIDFIKNYLDTSIEVDKESRRAFINISQNHYKYEIETLNEFMKDKPLLLNFLLTKVENIYYLPIEAIAPLIGFEVQYFADRNLVVIDPTHIDSFTIYHPIEEKWLPTENIGLVWDYVYQVTRDRREEEKISALDIVSPTWFKLSKNDGAIENNGVLDYVKDAHEKGYKVWGLVTNDFDPHLTNEFLADIEAQDNFIRQIVLYSSLYNLDGINIDFENIYYEDQDAFTEFVRILTEKLHQLNLTVSIDITIPSTSLNWSKVYDRQKLGEIVDYVAVMTYDEHWGSSPKSGSVASIGWVEKGIQATLDYIPPEKILLGLPFYTRLWEEEKQSEGSIKVSSRAYGMNAIASILEENNAVIQWDTTTGQYYSQYEKEEKTYKVWLEDQRSLALKASLIEKYQLAGFAAWRKDFEKEEVWDALQKIVKENKDYKDLEF